jgi:hypothetical protein
MSATVPGYLAGYNLIESLEDKPLNRSMELLRQLLQNLGVEVLVADFLHAGLRKFPRSQENSKIVNIWFIILQELLAYKVKYGHKTYSFLRTWSAVEVFLEFGADIPSWRRTELDVIVLEFGGTARNIRESSWHDESDNRNLLPALQHCPSDSVTMQDFVDHWQPPNAAAITRLLEERTTRGSKWSLLKVLFPLRLLSYHQNNTSTMRMKMRDKL